MLAGNPKENLIRAIDAYLKADAHTSSTRTVCQDLRSLRQDVEQAPNPVARHTGAHHADLLHEAEKAQGETHVHVHINAPGWDQAANAARERVRRG